MKRSAFFLLLAAFAATHLASAKDDKDRAAKAEAKKNAAVARHLPNAAPVRQNFHGRQHVQQVQQFNPNFNRRTVVDAEVRGDRRHHFTPNVGVTVDNAAVINANRINRQNWRNRVNANGSGNWQNNNPTVTQRTDSSVSNSDWQNRSGSNTEWNRSRWSNHTNWDRQRRNRSWWRSHYSRFALFGGGYYYWNSGYWYPAYGYDPYYSTYSYDAPIYAYNDQDPGQVIGDVQAALQRRGYDAGGVDGTYGPMTRRALLNYQRDNGLPVTGQIDESTLDSLGLQ